MYIINAFLNIFTCKATRIQVPAMAALASLLVDEYAKRYLPEDTARFAYLLSRLKKSR